MNLSKHLERSPVTRATASDQRETLNDIRAGFGMGPVSGRVAMLKTNAKLELDAGKVTAFGLSLNPASTHGTYNNCTWSTKGCRDACILDHAYQKSDSVRDSRAALTNMLATYPLLFVSQLMYELDLLIDKHGTIAVRLNTASDIRWERVAPAVFDTYGDRVMFYDYTKAPLNQRDVRDDYTLVYSVSERKRSLINAREYLDAGMSATIVLPVRYRSHSDHDAAPDVLINAGIVDHDVHDVRALDKGNLGFLRAKGSARSDTSGFVRSIDDALAIVA